MDKFDFHMHTTASDGTDNPTELYIKLVNENYKFFAFTDHDSIDGCLEVEGIADRNKFINGIEFSCKTEYGKCHILGYGINLKDSNLLIAIKKTQAIRKQKLESILVHLKENFNIEFSADELLYLRSLSNFGKPHVAKILVKRGLEKDISCAIKRFLPHMNKTDSLGANQAIEAILDAGGIPVWAHPLSGNPKIADYFELQLKLLISLGLQGIECYYSEYDLGQIQQLCSYANHYGMLITAGSDYHGHNKNVRIGTFSTEGFDVQKVLEDHLLEFIHTLYISPH